MTKRTATLRSRRSTASASPAVARDVDPDAPAAESSDSEPGDEFALPKDQEAEEEESEAEEESDDYETLKRRKKGSKAATSKPRKAKRPSRASTASSAAARRNRDGPSRVLSSVNLLTGFHRVRLLPYGP